MSSGQTKNSALITALAFHYQMLIGLEKCFFLQEGQSVWFEKDGDVSLDDGDIVKASQTEVKDYATPLTDHHGNLWNTLNNWIDPKFKHEKYGALVLHTTQTFGVTTRLKDWNAQTPEQRLNTLQEIYDERTADELEAAKPKKIVKLQQSVMGFEQMNLLQIITKVVLVTEADDAESLLKNIRPKLIGIPRNNHESYLQGLVGFVYAQSSKQSWQVKQTEFAAKCEELTSIFCKKEFTFPSFIGHEASNMQVNAYQDKIFVQKINEIEHPAVIPEAIGNWIELQNSLFEQLDEYPLYAEKTKSYQKQIVKLFNRSYSTAQLESTDQLKDSKVLYNRTVSEPPLSLGGYPAPIEYKNGLIHDAMDDEDQNLKWKVEQ